MSEIIIADSTCLIGLERIGKLDILPALFDSVIIPPEVAKEFGIQFPWLRIESISNQGLVLALKILIVPIVIDIAKLPIIMLRLHPDLVFFLSLSGSVDDVVLGFTET